MEPHELPRIAHDPAAFEVFYRAHVEAVQRFVARRVADPYLVSGGDPAAPAFAVERQADGSVTVEINSLRDAGALEQKLRAAGIAAVVDFTPDGKMCREPRGRVASGRHGKHSFGLRAGPNGSAAFTIPRGEVKSGETLVITSSLGAGVTSVGTEIVEGPVAPCELVDAPARPADPGPAASGPERGLSSRSADENGPSTHDGP